MSCFSLVTIDPELLPAELRNISAWQTKDLPDDEALQFPYDAYYDGAVRRDGVFVRADGMWNPTLSGWVELVADVGEPEFEICIRFANGCLAELVLGDSPPGDAAAVIRGWVRREA